MRIRPALVLGAATAALALAPAPPPHPAVRIREYDIPTPNAAPHCLVAAPDGMIWIAQIGTNQLGRFDPRTERFAAWSLPTDSSRPHGIVWASDGRLYLTEQRGNKLAAFDPRTERFTEYAVPSPEAGPHTPIEGSDGEIWFTEQRGNRVGRLNPRTGVITEYPVPTPNANVYGIIYARRENAVYFAELNGHKLGRVDAGTGRIEEFSTPTPNSGVRRLAVDRAGGIWMTYFRAGKVARFDPATRQFREFDAPGGRDAGPYAVSVDSTGHVWFNEFQPSLNDLVELDPATGEMTRYPIPTGPALVRKLTVDATNTVWYGNNGQGRIGRVIRE
jgi:virginiamycin B lyase